MLFQINKNLNHFLTPTLLPPCDTLNNTTQILIPGRAKEKSFRITSYQDLGIFGVKIPLNVSTVSLPSPSHTFHGAASELDFTLHSRSSKNEIFLFQKVSRRTLRFFFMLKQQKYYGNSYQFMGFCFVKVYQTLKLWCTTCVIIGNWYISFIPVFLQNIFLYFHFCIFLTLVEQAGWYKAGHIAVLKHNFSQPAHNSTLNFLLNKLWTILLNCFLALDLHRFIKYWSWYLLFLLKNCFSPAGHLCTCAMESSTDPA